MVVALWCNDCLFLIKTQDGEAKRTEEAEETDRAPTSEQQEADTNRTSSEVQDESSKEDSSVLAAQPSDISAPGLVGPEKTEEESARDPEGAPEVEVGEQEYDESRMHVLGHDDNIRTKSLEEPLPTDQVG